MEKVSYKAGDVILLQGQEGRNAFLITSGSAEVIVGEGDRERKVAVLKTGDVFGEMSLLAPGPRSATVQALEDTECAITSYDDFMVSIRENPEQALMFMQTLVFRLRKMNEMMAAIDPKRGLMGMLWDWMSAADLDDNMSDEERERRLAIHRTPMI